MQQYYLHNSFIDNGLRRNAKSIKINNKNLLCMSNGNILQFYQYTANGLRCSSKYNFNCNIKYIQILPTKQILNTDYIFILDKKGRYGFWSNNSGFQLLQNEKIQNNKSLYKTQQNQQVTFCGQIHQFDVFDTKGSIFFSINHSIIFIDYTINRLGLKIQNKTIVQIPYVQYRFINWIETKKNKMIGIIEQYEQKTILNIHIIDNYYRLHGENIVFKIQKPNLYQFTSSNQQIIMLSDDQIVSLSINQNYQTTYHYQINHGASSKIIHINQQTYCFLGQELQIFSNGKVKNYGSLYQQNINIIQKKGILQANLITNTQDGGVMICITTLNNQIYSIILYQNNWIIYHHLKSLNSIYSIHPTSNHDSLLVVMDQSIDQYQIAVVLRQKMVTLNRQQFFDEIIDRVIVVEGGNFIIACRDESNYLLRYNMRTCEYESILKLPNDHILMIKKNIMLTNKGVYTFSGEHAYYELIKSQQIIIYSCNQNRVIYLNAQGQVIQIIFQINDIQIIRNNISDQYVWHLMPNNNLIVGKTNNLQKLYIYDKNRLISELTTNQNTLINSIYHYSNETDIIIQDVIIIGYMNGHIYLYSMDGQLKASFNNICIEPIQFFSINHFYLGLISGQKQYILSLNNNKLQMNAIQLSKNGNKISAAAYLENTNQIIFIENDEIQSGKLVRIINLKDITQNIGNYLSNNDSYTIKSICQYLDQIPTVFLYNDYILVGLDKQLSIYSLSNGRKLKSIEYYLKDVLGIIPLDCGILVYGIDSIQRNLIYLYNYNDFTQICSINFILKDNKYIKSLKEIPNTNKFICRSETYTALCQLNSPKEIIEISQFKTELAGYSLQIDPEYSLIAQTDSKRLAVIFTYQNGILPIARYISKNEINDLAIFHRCVVIGDNKGFINILQFNTQEDSQALRMGMSVVGSINIGQQITALCKVSKSRILYGTISGQIGCLDIVSDINYMRLKKIELQQLNKQYLNNNKLNYIDWRQRINLHDKLIDGIIIKQYIEYNKNKQKQQINQIKYIYQQLIK